MDSKKEIIEMQLEPPGKKLMRVLYGRKQPDGDFEKLVLRSLDNLTVGMGEIIDYIRKKKKDEEDRNNRDKKKKRSKVLRTSKK